ncbi:TetR/AcrR family transcriptional regulator [Leucobacter tenebrionis]|uniref:TetR/AcrR family transcriptional regulator n=1 Tax=Leucobacter tenebrionis TaxID=2873270 RepID=UPI001CA63EDF|nr:TetR/AcrR family transcriptional regulator [Leucobacter tenebrionis]QZY52363.1 TetR/AcrR family transcriptional regulator [Leucobacter tenebrionis]
MNSDDTRTGTPRRPYRSTVREQQAARTRRAVTAAARDLFESEGFVGTTIAAIAERAGVSAQTVYSAFGTKAGVARAIIEQMEESAEAAQWRQRIAAEQDPERILEAFARWTCAFFATSRPSFTIAQGAMAELTELMAQGNERRRQGLTHLIERLAARDALRPGLGVDEAVDRAWLVTGVETFISATEGCGWPEDAYASWLAETLAQQILAQH